MYQLVAGPGFAPGSQGYGPRMVLLHYPAMKQKIATTNFNQILTLR